MNEAGTAQRRLDIRLRLHDISRRIEIDVADSGPGISEELRQRIFEPGFTTRANGNGFGLSTSLRIIRNHCCPRTAGFDLLTIENGPL
jgi:signal transduction histidine kinase